MKLIIYCAKNNRNLQHEILLNHFNIIGGYVAQIHHFNFKILEIYCWALHTVKQRTVSPSKKGKYTTSNKKNGTLIARFIYKRKRNPIHAS
jgi:hypothetical protein